MSSELYTDLPVPVPKPRNRYKRSGITVQTSTDSAVLSPEMDNSASSPGRHSNDAAVILQTARSFVSPTSPTSPVPRLSLRRVGSSSASPAESSPPPSPEAEFDPYVRVVPNWGDGSGSGSLSSGGEEDCPPAPSTPPRPLPPCPGEGNTELRNSSSAAVHVSPVPYRQAPPPPLIRAHSTSRPLKQKAPRAATIRVSRKKQRGAGGAGGPADPTRKESVVSRSSWLDVWKGRKHNVVWASLDGQLMSLWKKRNDKFSDVVFHVSSVTTVKKQEKRRFSVYFKKKHFEFMAHSDVVQEGWVASLLASRGRDPPAPPEQQGHLTMKDPRSRVYAAVYQHRLWIYNNKEDFQLGVGMTYVSMEVASVKPTGRHSFSLITPYKTFNFSADSSRDLAVWVDCLGQVIRSALSCSQVALQLWASPWNKVCADCGSASPEWASVNLLAVVCEECAGQHRSLGIGLSKVRSLKLDSKVWTDPLIQLFVLHGNQASGDVWGHNVPAAEQILPDCSVQQRSEFIQAKYRRGRYRRLHSLASNQALLYKRLCEVVCGPNVVETLSLLCSGARVHTGAASVASPLARAERAGQALQTELLRHNEYTEYPAYQHEKLRSDPASDPACDPASTPGEEELHGKLEEDRFLFSQENNDAACDVLDLREVVSVFDRSAGSNHEFEIVTLTDKLLCSADIRETLLAHLTHILKVVLPGPVEEADLGGLQAVARVSLREGDRHHDEVWAGLQRGGIILYSADAQRHRERLPLTSHMRYNMSSETTIELQMELRTLSLQFEGQHSCQSWFEGLAQATVPMEEGRDAALLPSAPLGRVPPAVDRCISHITLHGLKVEGVYRRCGVATKVRQLVEALCASPGSAPLETDEQGVLDAAAALKMYVRQQEALIPPQHAQLWVEAAAEPVEAVRLASYRKLLKQLPTDNRATLNTLCGHFYVVQLYSGDNKMTAQNLAVVFVPTLFPDQLSLNPASNSNMVRLSRELIIHHALLFMGTNVEECEEQITVL
ncbi:arf-GAP with Rho-GAP domain, ANK repeat and PH domain-containing protein 1 isoform X2 [Hypomesus transpacificus]|uniref:arf-GAP with Rho-GAP domain, ANK repeat and PH domain-containing protein 1 isoform X2 n=1 Tax=Hypomesus transpacificus TaxID=137520 RepID=UPI001F080A85|nr:arf-GAP with Rho-GAP domain, ANK repeat and PH domain-containing protein 1 isoform X2 [Hypomesus transpacificus]